MKFGVLLFHAAAHYLAEVVSDKFRGQTQPCNNVQSCESRIQSMMISSSLIFTKLVCISRLDDVSGISLGID